MIKNINKYLEVQKFQKLFGKEFVELKGVSQFDYHMVESKILPKVNVCIKFYDGKELNYSFTDICLHKVDEKYSKIVFRFFDPFFSKESPEGSLQIIYFLKTKEFESFKFKTIEEISQGLSHESARIFTNQGLVVQDHYYVQNPIQTV
jgi:hypothetical protein